MQKATRRGAASEVAKVHSPAGKDVDNGVAVAVESLYLFDMFLYTPEVAAVPTVAADGAAIS